MIFMLLRLRILEGKFYNNLADLKLAANLSLKGIFYLLDIGELLAIPIKHLLAK